MIKPILNIIVLVLKMIFVVISTILLLTIHFIVFFICNPIISFINFVLDKEVIVGSEEPEQADAKGAKLIDFSDLSNVIVQNFENWQNLYQFSLLLASKLGVPSYT